MNPADPDGCDHMLDPVPDAPVDPIFDPEPA